jgi:hypothetical protein
MTIRRGYYLRYCGGRSPITGQRTGQRHRWPDGRVMGKKCERCGRTLEEALVPIAPPKGRS